MKSTLAAVIMAIVLVAAYYTGKRYFLKPDMKTGVKAPAIEASLPDGASFSLASLQGKYVLLDFWGSWCKPCRESHPELVELFYEFQKKAFEDATGFEIVSYAIERNIPSWQNAIRHDGLIWRYHLMSGNLFDSEVAKSYNVKQIPTKFLINPEGVIIAVDPSIGEIRKMLSKRLT